MTHFVPCSLWFAILHTCSGEGHCSGESCGEFEGSSLLQLKLYEHDANANGAYTDEHVDRNMAPLTSTCKFEVLDMDFSTPIHERGQGEELEEEDDDDGYEYIVCHDQDSQKTHYLRDDTMTSAFESGDVLTVVLKETQMEAKGPHKPPWEVEKVPLYKVVQLKHRVPTSVLEMARREKYNVSHQVFNERKEMDIIMIICNYTDYKTEAYNDGDEAMNLGFYEKDSYDISYADALNLSSFGRLSAPRSRGKAVVVNMGKTLASVIDGGSSCPGNDCYYTSLKKIPEQYPGVDPDSYTFREFFFPRGIGSCGWAGLANVGCGHFSKLPNPGACWTYNLWGGMWLRRHELGHNQGLIHPRSYPMKEAGQDSWSDWQQVQSGGFSWDRGQMWQMGVLHDDFPYVFAWTAMHARVISLGSMALPFEETGATAASVKIMCPCCEPVIYPTSTDFSGDLWLQYRGTRGHFGGVGRYFWDKVFVHNIHQSRGDGEMWAALHPGETYNVPNSSVYIHFCAVRSDAVANVSLAFSPHEAKMLCPGAGGGAAATNAPVKIVDKDELGFPGLVCDFPFTYKGVVHNDCFGLDGKQGNWCVSGRPLPKAPKGCNETYKGNGFTYSGCANTTRSGRTCQRWDSTSPHRPYYNAGQRNNHCRNTDGGLGIWCYTTDPYKSWEYCDPLVPKYLKCSNTPAPTLPTCGVEDGSDDSSTYPCQCGSTQCRSGRKCTASTSTCERTCDETYSSKGQDYKGCQSTTRNGKTCQHWYMMSPHSHSYGFMGEHGNYCRNPSGDPSIWCYTTDRTERWDYCDPLPVSHSGLMASDPGNPDTCWPRRGSSPASKSTPTPSLSERRVGVLSISNHSSV